MTFYSEKLIAVAAVREAADLCQSVQRDLAASALQKEDRSPVTVADFGSQALVCSRLRGAYPNDPIIAEETAAILREEDNVEICKQVISRVREIRPDAEASQILEWIDYGGHKEQADRFWTLDPIDGTKGFLRRDQYAVALALIVADEVVVAALACPNLSLSVAPGEKGIVAVAVKDEGAELYTLRDMRLVGAAKVSEATAPAAIRLSESVEAAHTSHSGSLQVTEIMGISTPSTRLDSQAKYVVVAAGDAEIYMRLPSERRYVENIWDHAAGMLLVQEAGGMVTDIAGNNLAFKHGYLLSGNRGVLVSNGLLHDSLLKAIKTAGIE